MTQRKPLWYLASPYSTGDDQNPSNWGLLYERVCKVKRLSSELAGAGVHIYCPILVSSELRDFNPTLRDKGYEFWLYEFDENFMHRCDALAVFKLDGWKTSKGVNFEEDYFKSRGKPVAYISKDYDLYPMEKTVRNLEATHANDYSLGKF
jgi:nucleoside 2-deoxyribosyltransferase